MKKQHEFPGILISIEGCEGSGKTTQTELLRKKMETRGWQVMTAREPGGTRVGEQIREVVLAKENSEIVDKAEVLLYQASRAQLYGEVVLPALAEGKIVLMDRTGDSSVVYQGMVRGVGEKWITQLNEFSMYGLVPDLTILLDVPVAVGMERQAAFKVNRIELQGLAFHEKVRAGYLKLAKENLDGRWRIVNAEQEVEKVTGEIWEIVENYIEKKVI